MIHLTPMSHHHHTQAELDLRGISYAGIFDRADLETLLVKARKEGAARPEILDQFNEQVEQQKQ